MPSGRASPAGTGSGASAGKEASEETEAGDCRAWNYSAGGNGKAAVIGRGDCGKGFRLAGSECTADQEEVRPLRIYSLDNPAAGWNLMGAIEHLASASLDS